MSGAGPESSTAPAGGRRASWWRMNRWGLVLLVPVLALALAASSFRLVTLYFPWFAVRGTHVTAPVRVTTDSSFVRYPAGEEYSATLTPASLVPVSSAPSEYTYEGDPGLSAPPGARIWRLTTRVDADPAMSLIECAISLLDAEGAHYEAGLAMVDADGSVPVASPSAGGCVPRGTPGPFSDLRGDIQPVVEGEERPAQYSVETYFVLPTTVTPDRVRIDMSRGGYWTTDAPGT